MPLIAFVFIALIISTTLKTIIFIFIPILTSAFTFKKKSI